jgi:hypothetical protein
LYRLDPTDAIHLFPLCGIEDSGVLFPDPPDNRFRRRAILRVSNEVSIAM